MAGTVRRWKHEESITCTESGMAVSALLDADMRNDEITPGALDSRSHCPRQVDLLVVGHLRFVLETFAQLAFLTCVVACGVQVSCVRVRALFGNVVMRILHPKRQNFAFHREQLGGVCESLCPPLFVQTSFGLPRLCSRVAQSRSPEAFSADGPMQASRDNSSLAAQIPLLTPARQAPDAH